MEGFLPEEELIEYVKPYLKSKGFKKKNKRWTKDTGEFTISFLIQGSCYSKEDYYIRPGVFINSLLPENLDYYGHWFLEIRGDNPETVMRCFTEWAEEWTNNPLIKERLLAFLEWEGRNPLEKRRANQVDYEADPVPAQEFFGVSQKVRQYVLENF